MSEDFLLAEEARTKAMVHRNPKIDIANATYNTATAVLNPSSFFHFFPIASTTTTVVQLPTLGNGISFYFRGYATCTVGGAMAFKPQADEYINQGAKGANLSVPAVASTTGRHFSIVGDAYSRTWYIQISTE